MATLDTSGNVIQNGYSTNLSPSQYNTVPNVMAGADVKSTATPVPTVPLSQTDPLSSLVAQSTLGLNTAQTGVTTQEGKVDTAQDESNRLSKLLLGETPDTISAQQSQGVPQLGNDIRNLQLDIQGKQQKYLQGLSSIEGGNIRSLSNNQNVALSRQNALDVAIASSQLAAKQGNLIYANELVKNAIDAKYQPIKDALALQNQILTQDEKGLTRADSKLAAEKVALNSLKLKQVEKQQADDEAKQSLIVNASSQGAPADVLSRANRIIENGGTRAEVAAGLGQYAGNYWNTEKLKQDILESKANTEYKTAQAKELKIKNNQIVGTGTYLDPKVLENPTFKLAQALGPVRTAISRYQQAIKDYGSFELANASGKGEIQQSYGNAIAAWKTMAGLGALSGADFGLAENVIPAPTAFTRNSVIDSQLAGAVDSATSQINGYAGTLKTAYPTSSKGIDEVLNANKPIGIIKFSVPSTPTGSYAETTMNSVVKVNSAPVESNINWDAQADALLKE